MNDMPDCLGSAAGAAPSTVLGQLIWLGRNSIGQWLD
jgi:hypothetical protein